MDYIIRKRHGDSDQIMNERSVGKWVFNSRGEKVPDPNDLEPGEFIEALDGRCFDEEDLGLAAFGAEGATSDDGRTL